MNSCAVFKELLLPVIENCRLKLVLVTQIGYGNMINQVTLEDVVPSPGECNCGVSFSWTSLRL
jgi:hypothetical protein